MIDKQITLIATTRYGLERIVKNELNALGFNDLDVSAGLIAFPAQLTDIPRVNLWLRTVDRVRVKIGDFKAVTFDELFEQTKALPWEEWISADGRFIITGKSNKSTLFSIRSSQAIVNKAIAERLMDAYDTDHLPESGPAYTVQVSLHNDIATLSIDTSGAGLHKRGFREEAGEAPLKETLASVLVQLSVWDRDRRLIDPMCGSGTILIEAAMIARNIAPGLQRSFASEQWDVLGKEMWQVARREAIAAQCEWENPQLFGYDINPVVLEVARRNAHKAGVGSDIVFAEQEVKKLWIDRQYGVIITNPPYGMRMADFMQMNQIYIALNKMFRKKMGWSVYVFTADKKFPDYFHRSRPTRVRKLYNGPIEANYYQYMGEKPKRVSAENPSPKQQKDPLHGVTLQMMLEYLVDKVGWDVLGDRINIRCFQNNPTIKSSLTFLRRTEWARKQVEKFYLTQFRAESRR